MSINSIIKSIIFVDNTHSLSNANSPSINVSKFIKWYINLKLFIIVSYIVDFVSIKGISLLLFVSFFTLIFIAFSIVSSFMRKSILSLSLSLSSYSCILLFLFSSFFTISFLFIFFSFIIPFKKLS